MVDQSPQKKNNSTLIILLVVVIGACALCIPIGAAILFPVFSQAKVAAKKAASTSNLKVINLGMMLYAADYDDRYCRSERWCDDLGPYVKASEVWKSPMSEAKDEPRSDYAMVAARAGQKTPPVLEQANVPVVFESGSGAWNQSGHYELLPDPARYTRDGKGQALIGFADGSVKLVTYESLGLGR